MRYLFAWRGELIVRDAEYHQAMRWAEACDLWKIQPHEYFALSVKVRDCVEIP